MSFLLCFLNHSAVLDNTRLEVKTRGRGSLELKLGRAGVHSLKLQVEKKEKGLSEEEQTLIFHSSSSFLSTDRHPLTNMITCALHIYPPAYVQNPLTHLWIHIHTHTLQMGRRVTLSLNTESFFFYLLCIPFSLYCHFFCELRFIIIFFSQQCCRSKLYINETVI